MRRTILLAASFVGVALGGARAADSDAWLRCHGVPPGQSYQCPPGAVDDCALRRGKTDSALMIAGCTEVIQAGSEPADRLASAYALRGKGYYVQDDVDRAIADETQALARDPKSIWAFYIRGQAFLVKHDYDRAIADATQAITVETPDAGATYEDDDGTIQTRPAYTDALLLRGSAYCAKGDCERAIEDFTAAIEHKPTFGGSYVDRGDAFARLGDYARAIADFTRALQFDPNDAPTYSLRGMTYLHSGNFGGAMDDLSKSIALDPKNGNTYRWRGWLYLVMRDPVSALADAEKAVEYFPSDPSPWVVRCAVRAFANKDIAIAKTDCDKALSIDPKIDKGSFFRSLVNLRLGDYDACIADANDALAFNPRDTDALYIRGIAKLRKGDSEHGAEDVRNAVTTNPGTLADFAGYDVAP